MTLALVRDKRELQALSSGDEVAGFGQALGSAGLADSMIRTGTGT